MVLPVLGTRFRNFQVQPCRTTTSISEVVFKLVLDPHRQQVRGPGILDTENMFHLILHIENVLQLNFSANKKQNLGGQNTHEVVVVANVQRGELKIPLLVIGWSHPTCATRTVL